MDPAGPYRNSGTTGPNRRESQATAGRILGDEVKAAALLDRLLHRCHIVNIRGNSYRMRHHAELSKAIHPLAGIRTKPDSPAREPVS